MPTDPLSKTIRILHVFKHYELFSKGGGVERYNHHVATRSAAAGCGVTVFAQVADAAPENLGYRIECGSYAQLWEAVGNADIVHIHGPRERLSAAAGMIALLRRRPLFYTIHCFYRGKTPWQTLQKYLWDHLAERRLFRGAFTTIFLSDFWRDYSARLGLKPRHFMLLPNGIDSVALQAEKVSPTLLVGDPAILSVSRLDPVKCIDDVIRVLAEPSMDKAHLHIVGLGPDELRLQALIAARKLESQVTFHHFKNDDEVAAMARAAHVFVLASVEEGMPTTILEMLARGLPVVASEIPGNMSIMERLQNKATYPLGDIAALAQSIAMTAHQPLAENIQDDLRRYFDWGAIVATLLARYQQAVAGTAQRTMFIDCPLDCLSPQMILECARAAMTEKKLLVIEGLNVAKLVQSHRDPLLMHALDEADIVHIDGAGIALGGKLLGYTFPARRAGIDLMMDLLKSGVTLDKSVFLLGAKEVSVAAAAAAMQQEMPNLKIAGYRNGYFAAEDEVGIVQQIRESGASLLLLGMSSPKKELFLHRYKNELGIQVAMGVGGAFDVVAGLVKRAPGWMQAAGLEWMFRLLQEPRRLLWRYLDTNTTYAYLLLKNRLKGVRHAAR